MQNQTLLRESFGLRTTKEKTKFSLQKESEGNFALRRPVFFRVYFVVNPWKLCWWSSCKFLLVIKNVRRYESTKTLCHFSVIQINVRVTFCNYKKYLTWLKEVWCCSNRFLSQATFGLNSEKASIVVVIELFCSYTQSKILNNVCVTKVLISESFDCEKWCFIFFQFCWFVLWYHF